MATLYVDGSRGNDGNDGSTWSLAKASIGGAITAASGGDTITIAPGIFTEVLTVAKALAFQAVQRHTVVVYGTALDSSLVYATAACSWNNTVVRGIFSSNYKNVLSATVAQSCTDCVFERMAGSSLYGSVVARSTASNNPDMTLTNCLCVQQVGGANNYNMIRLSGASSVVGCTIINNSGGSYSLRFQNDGAVVCADNIFVRTSNAAYVFVEATPPSVLLDYNCYKNAIDSNRKLSISGVDYTSLAAAQVAGYENNGSEGDPLFADTARKAYFLPKDSVLLTAGSSGGRVGAWTGAHTFSAGANAWSAWTASNCTWVDNQWTLDDGQASGTVTSPVIDLGAAYNVTGLAFDGEQTFPTNILDKTNTGANPEYQTVEIRGQAGTFDAGDGTPAWQEMNTNVEADPILGGWRYAQCRLTLRSDGS